MTFSALLPHIPKLTIGLIIIGLPPAKQRIYECKPTKRLSIDEKVQKTGTVPRCCKAAGDCPQSTLYLPLY